MRTLIVKKALAEINTKHLEAISSISDMQTSLEFLERTDELQDRVDELYKYSDNN